MYLYVTKDLDTKEFRVNTLDNPEKMCLHAWKEGKSRQILLGKTKDYSEEDLKLPPEDVIKLIKRKTGNIFEYEELFNTDLPDYGSVGNILNEWDKKRIRLVIDIRKESEKVKVEVVSNEDADYHILCFKCEDCKEDQVHILGLYLHGYELYKKYTLDHSKESYLDYLELKMENETRLGYITIN